MGEPGGLDIFGASIVTAIEKYVLERGNSIYVIDELRAGIGLLEQRIRNKRMLQKR